MVGVDSNALNIPCKYSFNSENAKVVLEGASRMKASSLKQRTYAWLNAQMFDGVCMYIGYLSCHSP
jgi:hypothetical protein